ncbi:hypothetical protein [Paenibacillus sepulcri]|uniref:hypothetical protein n=1 Tax=Paenibacillus sepulcri TaxID=359917 RepID=UPI001AE8D4C2
MLLQKYNLPLLAPITPFKYRIHRADSCIVLFSHRLQLPACGVALLTAVRATFGILCPNP